MELGSFVPQYESWYSKALAVASQLTLSRLTEFKEAYRHEKRRELELNNYSISDYLLGMRGKRNDQPLFNAASAFRARMLRQVGLVHAATQIAPSILRDIKGTLRAELFNSDLATAKELLKAKPIRAAGVVCGVVLEFHLSGCCNAHNVKSTKKNPGISDLMSF